MLLTNLAILGASRIPNLSRTLLSIYNALLHEYGDRHWWPADSPFEMMVGAILTQNVSWKNAARAISNLKDAGLLTPSGIKETPPVELASLIKPASFMNVKARRLKSYAEWYCAEFGGDIQRMSKVETPTLRRMLLSVNGIGEETADSILLYACGKPVFVVDAYTRRVLGRLGLIRGNPPYSEIQCLFMENLPKDTELFKDYHAQIVQLAKDRCRRKPLCCSCPLRNISPTIGCRCAP